MSEITTTAAETTTTSVDTTAADTTTPSNTTECSSSIISSTGQDILMVVGALTLAAGVGYGLYKGGSWAYRKTSSWWQNRKVAKAEAEVITETEEAAASPV